MAIQPWRCFRFFVVLCIVAAIAGVCAAQQAFSSPIARLSHLAGSVQVQRQDGTNPPRDAVLNMQIEDGQRLVSEENGEAEVEFPDGSILRLTPNGVVMFDSIASAGGKTEVELSGGLFYLELRASDYASFKVRVGDTTILPVENASFRVQATEGQIDVAAMNGVLSLNRPNAYTAELKTGEELRSDPKDENRYLLSDSISPQDWDSWNEKLAQNLLDQGNARTAARNPYAGNLGYGWSDLDASGTWYDVPGEGQVWQPVDADADFDPYSHGSWVYETSGYVWASSYSWGWLPYHCGAWNYYTGFGWGWLPAVSCQSFGAGGDHGAMRVRHAPTGWHPPRRPVTTAAAGDSDSRRNLSASPRRSRIGANLSAAEGAVAEVVRPAEPVKISGVFAQPLPRVGNGYTSRGGSAVGSSLWRDFPVKTATRQPIFGRPPQGLAAAPGGEPHLRRVSLSRSPGNPETNRPHSTVRPDAAPGGIGLNPNGKNAERESRLPRSSDPPVNANGNPSVNANGAPPVNANGAPPLGGSGTPVPGAQGVKSNSLGATEVVAPVQQGNGPVGISRPERSRPSPGVPTDRSQRKYGAPQPEVRPVRPVVIPKGAGAVRMQPR